MLRLPGVCVVFAVLLLMGIDAVYMLVSPSACLRDGVAMLARATTGTNRDTWLASAARGPNDKSAEVVI
jgi:hypothetical protein